MKRVDFAANALFKSYGDIFRAVLTFLLTYDSY